MKKTRGGAPAPIRELISVSAYDDRPTNFRPSYAYDLPSSLRDVFSLALMQNLRRDDPTYNPLSDTEEFVDEFKIERIRGTEVEELFTGTMSDLDDTKIKNFLVNLHVGDRLKLTLA